jgi:predicted heme/steroid binding protein
MTRLQRTVIIASVVIAVLIVVGAAVAVQRRTPAAQVPVKDLPRTVSQAELKRSDGREGRPCLVAVDGTVYRIEGFDKWQDGKHIPSEGQAYCGADLSAVIDKSPHGRKQLDILIKVGRLGS